LPCPQRGQGTNELAPVFPLKQSWLLLDSTLLVFLVLNVFPDHFGVQANSINTVAFGTKMITPIGFFLEVSKFVKDTNCGSTLYPPTQKATGFPVDECEAG